MSKACLGGGAEPPWRPREAGTGNAAPFVMLNTPKLSNTNGESVSDAVPAVIRLPSHVTMTSLSAACRDAWRVFVEQSEEWGSAEQVLWSGGLYAPIRRYASEGMPAAVAASSDDLEDAQSEDDYETVDPRFLERMILTARAKAFDALTSFALPRARLSFGIRMREEGAVTRCVDRFGNTGYVPTPTAGSLADRVLALIAADLLNRPGDFEGETLCSGCGGVTVGPSACCAHTELGRHETAESIEPATVRFDIDEKVA